MLKITTNAALDAHLLANYGQTIVLKGGRTVYVGQPTATVGGYHWTVVAYDEDEREGYAILNAEEGLRSTLDWIENYGVDVLV